MRRFIGRSVRVLVVSAHFPPNFVSGGTLVPYRSAIELARRGHELAVFAGWIGPSPHAGSAFEEAIVTHELGGRAVPVRWFTTNDAIDWGSRLNYDNTAAAAEFAGMLQTFSPDVVHFHSMQGLGAGLLREAARAGVPFVVTGLAFDRVTRFYARARRPLAVLQGAAAVVLVAFGAILLGGDLGWLSAQFSSMLDHLGLQRLTVS